MRLVEATPTQANLQKIATCMLEVFAERRIALAEHPELRRDLQLMQIEERANNSFRLVSPVTSDGSHGDVGTAFCLALLAASEMASRQIVVAGTIGAGEDLSPYQRHMKKIADINAELKELHEHLRTTKPDGLADALREGRVFGLPQRGEF